MRTSKLFLVGFIALTVVFSSIAPAYGQSSFSSAAQRLRAALRNLRAQVNPGTTATTPSMNLDAAKSGCQSAGGTWNDAGNYCNMPGSTTGGSSYTPPGGTTVTTGTYNPPSGGGSPEAMRSACTGAGGTWDSTGNYCRMSGSSGGSGPYYPAGTTPPSGTTYSGGGSGGQNWTETERAHYQSETFKSCVLGRGGSQATVDLVRGWFVPGRQPIWGQLVGVEANAVGGCNPGSPGTGTYTPPSTGGSGSSSSGGSVPSESFYLCLENAVEPMSRKRYNDLTSVYMSSASGPEKTVIASCSSSSGGTGTNIGTGTSIPPSGYDPFPQCLATATSDSNMSSIPPARQEELKRTNWQGSPATPVTSGEKAKRIFCEGSGNFIGSPASTDKKAEPPPETFYRCVASTGAGITRSRLDSLMRDMNSQTVEERGIMSKCGSSSGGGSTGRTDNYDQYSREEKIKMCLTVDPRAFYAVTRTREECEKMVDGGPPVSAGGSVRVISPNGGESLKNGDIVTISWTGTTNPVEISLQSWMPPCDQRTQPCPMMSTMPMWGYIIQRGAISPNTWKVGTDANGQRISEGSYVVMVSGSAGSDSSDGPFQIGGGGTPPPSSPPEELCTMEAGYVYRQVGDAIEERQYTNGCQLRRLLAQGWRREGTPIGQRPPERIVEPRPEPRPQPVPTPSLSQDEMMACVSKKTGVPVERMMGMKHGITPDLLSMLPQMMIAGDQCNKELARQLRPIERYVSPEGPAYPYSYPDSGQSEEEMARQLAAMKRGVGSIERLVARLERKVSGLDARGLSISEESLEALRLLKEVIAQVKAATASDEVFEFMDEVPRLMQTVNYTLRPEIELLTNAPAMVAEMNRAVRLVKRSQRRLGIKPEEVTGLTELYQAAQAQLKAKDYNELRETFKDFQEELFQLRQNYPGLGNTIYLGIAPIEFPGFELDQ